MNLVDAYVKALKSMQDSPPDDLPSVAAMFAGKGGSAVDVSENALRTYLENATVDDPLRKRLHLAVATWDAQVGADWANDTAQHSYERRNLIYELLGVEPATGEAFDDAFPRISDEIVVISDDQIDPWYTEDVQHAHDFYWQSYKKQLVGQGWPESTVANLDAATTEVVAHLADPAGHKAQKSKGIVVGYVQSGKTANYTGVIAKAIDAGYRLIIVLTGTVDILRQQTQRRLDMELVGTDNIYLGADPDTIEDAKDVDYLNDPARIAGKFTSFGYRPSAKGFPDIIRLTSYGSDYRNLKAGITALEFEKPFKQKPLFEKENLYVSNGRLAVVKKNAHVLGDLLKNLKSIKSHLGQIPALIIDDESDQASLNTTNPKTWEEGQKQRTAINTCITELLKLLPRGQYVGYTATPYANVFVDPSDVEDIFPSNFLISLNRPVDYMGGAEFLDLDESFDDDAPKTVANSNEKAFVRDLRGTTVAEVDTELLSALDTFLLSGAIKLFRASRDSTLRFRHHTMLVHASVKQVEHRALSDKVKVLWKGAGYTDTTAQQRLSKLLEDDFRPVSAAREPDLPFPTGYDQLKPFIGQALGRIQKSGGNPVLVVNGDQDLDQEDLDFGQQDVWRILVGGAKLSRGFTVEGLTTSYYLRRTGWADALMQMGRWFGFRPGYRDLVRLFIGRAVTQGTNTYDLYEMFKAAERDERAFREELKRYSKPVDGKAQITPRDIPPLVSQHLLPPAAPNKMYNAELIIRRSPGLPIEPTAYPDDPKAIADNYAKMLPLFKAADELKTFKMSKSGKFNAYVGSASAATVLDIMRHLEWSRDEQFRPDLAYIEEITPDWVEDWVLIAPQLQKNGPLTGIGERSLFARERRRGPLFGAISDPKHRSAASLIAGTKQDYSDPFAASLTKPRRGSILLYPIATKAAPSAVISAFVLFPPATAITGNGRAVQFMARDSGKAGKAIIDRPTPNLVPQSR